LIGNYQGTILICDHAEMHLDGRRLQRCCAHLKRDVQKLIDSNAPNVKCLGYDLLRQQKLLLPH
jgi:hypothetical protein